MFFWFFKIRYNNKHSLPGPFALKDLSREQLLTDTVRATCMVAYREGNMSESRRLCTGNISSGEHPASVFRGQESLWPPEPPVFSGQCCSVLQVQSSVTATTSSDKHSLSWKTLLYPFFIDPSQSPRALLFGSVRFKVPTVSAVTWKTWTGFSVKRSFSVQTGGMDWITMHSLPYALKWGEADRFMIIFKWIMRGYMFATSYSNKWCKFRIGLMYKMCLNEKLKSIFLWKSLRKLSQFSWNFIWSGRARKQIQYWLKVNVLYTTSSGTHST